MFGHGARVLSLELVPVPGYGTQITARAPTEGYVQTGARAPSLNRASDALQKYVFLIYEIPVGSFYFDSDEVP